MPVPVTKNLTVKDSPIHFTLGMELSTAVIYLVSLEFFSFVKIIKHTLVKTKWWSRKLQLNQSHVNAFTLLLSDKERECVLVKGI